MDDHGSASEAAQPTSSAAAEASLAEMAVLQMEQAVATIDVGVVADWKQQALVSWCAPEESGVGLALRSAVESVSTIDVGVVADWKQQALVSWPALEEGVGLAALRVEEEAATIDVGVVGDWRQQALVSWPALEEGVGLSLRWVEEAASEGLSLAASSVLRWADELSASSLVSSSLMAGLEVLATSPMHESVAMALRVAGDGPTSWAGAAIATLPSGSDLWPDVAASWWGGEPTGAFAAVEVLSEHLAKVPTVKATSLLSSGLASSIDDDLNQTAAGLAAAGTSFCESLRAPAVSAALFDAGAVVAPVRPAALPAPGTVSAPVSIPIEVSRAQEPTVERPTEVERGLREEIVLLRAEVRGRAGRLGGYEILMAVLAGLALVEPALGAAVVLEGWVPWELLWALLVHFVAWWVGGGPA